jgi:hypothetical protein
VNQRSQTLDDEIAVLATTACWLRSCWPISKAIGDTVGVSSLEPGSEGGMRQRLLEQVASMLQAICEPGASRARRSRAVHPEKQIRCSATGPIRTGSGDNVR